MKNEQTVLDIECIPSVTPEGVALVENIRKQHPELFDALSTFRASYGTLADSYRALCGAFRSVTLPEGHRRLLLTNEGWSKSRISDFETIIDSPESVFQDYIKRLIGFKVALEAARGGEPVHPLPVTTGKAYDALAAALNSVDTSVFVMKKSKFKFERLGLVYSVQVVRKKVRAVKKAAKKKGGKKK